MTITGYTTNKTAIVAYTGENFDIIGSGFDATVIVRWQCFDLKVAAWTPTKLTVIAPKQLEYGDVDVVALQKGSEIVLGPVLIILEKTPVPPPQPVSPLPPSNLGASLSGTAANLIWTDKSDNETGFEIERRFSGGTFAKIAVTAANVVTFAASGLTPNSTYTFRVRAVNAAGSSAYSNEVSVSVPPVPPSTTDPILDKLEPASGPPGTVVNLVGRNFATVKGYAIWTIKGGVPYRFVPTAWTDTLVTMPAPVQGTLPGVATGPVYLRRADGKVTNMRTFTVTSEPPPPPPPPPPSGLVVTGYSVGSSVAAGQQFSVLGAGFVGATAIVEWGGLDLHIVRGSATEITVIAPDEEGTEVVTVRQGNDEDSGPPLRVILSDTPPPPPPSDADLLEARECVRLFNVERQKVGLMPFAFATAPGEVSQITVGDEIGEISWMSSEGVSSARGGDIIAAMAAVTEDARLMTAAKDFALELLRRQALTHTGEDGSDPGTRMRRAGWSGNQWGEVAGRGFSTAAAMVQGWLNSPGHRVIVLGAQYSIVGVWRAMPGGYWVGDFGG